MANTRVQRVIPNSHIQLEDLRELLVLVTLVRDLHIGAGELEMRG